MKSGSVLVALSIILVMAFSGCATTVNKPAGNVVGTEDAAVAKLGDDILSLRLMQFKDKRIGIFYFTTLDWQILDPGKRISNKLTGYLTRKGGIKIVPLAEVQEKMKIQAIELARIYDVDAKGVSGNTRLPDVIVSGIMIQDMGTVTIDMKAMDLATGRVILLSGVRIPATGEFSTLDKPELTALYKKSPEKITQINKSFYMLKWMKDNQPLVFMLVTVKNKEMKELRKNKTVLYGKMEKRKSRYERERPDVMKKITALVDGLSLMERYDQPRFGEVMQWKKALLARMK